MPVAIGKQSTGRRGPALQENTIEPIESDDVIGRVNEILGYDVLETQAIEADRDLYDRLIARLNTDADLISADEIFGDDAE